MQGLLGGIKDKQRKLQEAHERTKTVTRTGEMKGIRERMQVRPHEPLAVSNVSNSVQGAPQRQQDLYRLQLNETSCQQLDNGPRQLPSCRLIWK